MHEHMARLTLDRRATYQIKVPGSLEERWLDWNSGLTLTVGSDCHGTPISTLTIQADQAALHGLLRHLYSLGLPLISVILMEQSASEASDP